MTINRTVHVCKLKTQSELVFLVIAGLENNKSSDKSKNRRTSRPGAKIRIIKGSKLCCVCGREKQRRGERFFHKQPVLQVWKAVGDWLLSVD